MNVVLDTTLRCVCVCVCSLEEVRGEFDDFQESSRELEAELEAQLEQAESVNKDLLSRIQRVEEENESVKVNLSAYYII